jgi:hypothetical protein
MQRAAASVRVARDGRCHVQRSGTQFHLLPPFVS